MEVPSVQELCGLKYSELQKLAKQAGLKANMKADRLLKALQKHFHPAASPEQMSEDSDGSCTVSDKDGSPSCEGEEEPLSSCHITHRRARYTENLQKESIPTLINLKADESDKDIQMPKCEQIEENNNNNEKAEESARLGSTRRQRKHQKTKDVAADKTKMLQRKSSSASKLPRHTRRLSKAGTKSSTPNFKKIHEAHFKKMESIDKYMERKQKRLDTVSSSIDEVKMMAMKSNLLTQAGKTPGSSTEKLLESKFFILSPAPEKGLRSPTETPAGQRQPARISTASRRTLANKSALKPFSLSVSKMNVRFSETTKDNEHKQSLIKTPARKSFCFETPENGVRSSFPLRKSEPVLEPNKALLPSVTDLESEASKTLVHKSGSEENKMNQSATTPFKFSAQAIETPNTNKKFDLQASLQRPLGYQPHKGKLKPWGQAKENHAGTRNNISEMKKSFKQPIRPTRDDRRKQHEEGRKLKRDKAVGTRRGVVMQ